MSSISTYIHPHSPQNIDSFIDFLTQEARQTLNHPLQIEMTPALLTIPREIRDKIYRYALISHFKYIEPQSVFCYQYDAFEYVRRSPTLTTVVVTHPISTGKKAKSSPSTQASCYTPSPTHATSYATKLSKSSTANTPLASTLNAHTPLGRKPSTAFSTSATNIREHFALVC